MSNENKPNWNDLQNAQAETNAWQIDKIWMTAKKLPMYFWVLTILLTATMLNTLRLHYVMQDMVKAENQKTEMNRDLALKYHKNRSERESGLRDKIEELNGVIEKMTNKTAGMRAAIQRKDATIADLAKKVGENYVFSEKLDEHKHRLGN
mgnify:CR=1 FL=1|tara:strand:+ start:997 stop:1446 length:450 start_codon:yes stop_codon:yes gene_type:complete